MIGETVVTFVGNLVDDPDLRYTSSGQAMARFRVASTPQHFDRETKQWREGESLFLTCSVWRQAAEHVAESLERGMRVIVHGRLRQRTYETENGDRRTAYELEVDEVGPSLRNAKLSVEKVTKAAAPRIPASRAPSAADVFSARTSGTERTPWADEKIPF
jgi:single-strand DNA-binding protein